MDLTKFDFDFEGRTVSTIVYKGRPCWIAKELGNVIGYSDHGGRIVTKLVCEWGDEFVRGEDFEKIQGKELADFKALLQLLSGSESSFLKHAPSTILLYESGMYLALTKTNKPQGKALRRKIVSEILPQIARDGRYDPNRSVDAAGKIVGSDSFGTDLEAKKEKLLAYIELSKIKSQLLDVQLDNARKIAAIEGVKHGVPNIAKPVEPNTNTQNTDSRVAPQPVAKKPVANGSRADWLSPTDIARKFGIDRTKIGLVISKLKIRGDIDGIAFAHKIKKGENTFTCYKYSPKAVEMIRKKLFCPPTSWVLKYGRFD